MVEAVYSGWPLPVGRVPVPGEGPGGFVAPPGLLLPQGTALPQVTCDHPITTPNGHFSPYLSGLFATFDAVDSFLFPAPLSSVGFFHSTDESLSHYLLSTYYVLGPGVYHNTMSLLSGSF